MHDGPQLKPTPGQSLLQLLHRPGNTPHNNHPRRNTRSRRPKRLIKRKLGGQSLSQRIVASRPHCPKHPIRRKPGKPLSRIAQRVFCRETSPLEPQQLTISANNPRHRPQAPLSPLFTRSLPPKLSGIPPKRRRPLPKRQRKIQFRIRPIEDDIVLRQPIELRLCADPHIDPLLRFAPIRLVPLGRPRRGNHSMRASAHIDIDRELIAARDAARRMHDHRMTDAMTFGIKRPLHPQRPIMQPMPERGPLTVPDKAEFEARAPLRMRSGLLRGLHGSERGVIFVKRHANEVRPDEEKQSVPAHVRQRSTALPQDGPRIARVVRAPLTRRSACARHLHPCSRLRHPR